MPNRILPLLQQVAAKIKAAQSAPITALKGHVLAAVNAQQSLNVELAREVAALRAEVNTLKGDDETASDPKGSSDHLEHKVGGTTDG